jgi:hypothetical protein
MSGVEGPGWPEDQVVRHMEFLRRYPQVTTVFDRRTDQWNATWPGGKARSRELKNLLDELEEKIVTSKPGSGQ